jgi:ADP-ribose pyrophosphatase YjhB (NUDIX family)
MSHVRNSAKAIIIRDSKILLTRNHDEGGEFYLLPGGGQEFDETLTDALRRECMEEIGTEITIGELRYIREYIGKNHQFSKWDRSLHQVEFMFECKVPDNYEIVQVKAIDKRQIGIEWIELGRIHEYPLYPKKLQELISSKGLSGPIYLGDVN